MLHFIRYTSYIGKYLENITPDFIFLQIITICLMKITICLFSNKCERSELLFSESFESLLQINFHKDGIPLILLDSQVFFGYAVGGVIKQVHQKSGRNPLLPGVVAESFAQRVTADMRGM